MTTTEHALVIHVIGAKVRSMKYVLVLVGSVLVAGTARAQPPEPIDDYFPDRLSGWRFEVGTFGILPIKIHGDAAVGKHTVPFEATIADVLSKLDFALTGHFEAWKGRWGAIATGQSYWTTTDRTIAGVPTSLGTATYVGNLLFARRFGAFNIEDKVSFALDAEAGPWLTHIKNDLTIGDASFSASKTFVKAMLAARPILRITPSWAVLNRSYVSFPDVSWQTMICGEYDWRYLAFEAGYSAQRVVLSGDRVAVTATSHGPYVAIAYRWGAGALY